MKRYSYILLPLVLLGYLAFIAVRSYDSVESGQISMLRYVLTLCGTFAVLVALVLVLRRRNKLRREREEDIEKTENNK